MGAWGNDLYENDVALDVKDMIERVQEDNPDDTIFKSTIVSEIEDNYDEEDQVVAWLVIADKFLARFPTRETYEQALGGYRQVDVQEIKRRFLSEGKAKKKRRPRKRFVSSWKIGDVYLYDMPEEYRNDAAFIGWTVGFYCIDFYEYAGKHPIVYFFRSRASAEELSEHPELALDGTFWRVFNWGKLGFAYRLVLFTDTAPDFPEERLHFCGSIDEAPHIPDEFVIFDKPSTPLFFWANLEQELLITRAKQIVS